MTRQEKTEIVEGLVERFSSADHFYIINAQGLNLEETNDFRRRCFKEGVTYQVVKNTLIQKALEKLESEVDYSPFNDTVLKGFSGILFPQEIANIPAKIIKDFRKERKIQIPLFKGALIDKDLFVGEENLDVLSDLKSKTELIGELIGLLKSPITRVMSSLQSGKHQLSGIVQAVAAKKQ